MNDARQWLAARIAHAPEQLRSRMMASLPEAESETVHEQLARAAWRCLEKTLADPSNRESALDLLAADALLTHASEAAAEAGSDTLRQFAAAWNAARFEELLTSRTR